MKGEMNGEKELKMQKNDFKKSGIRKQKMIGETNTEYRNDYVMKY